MNKPKHTPGPWHLKPSNDNRSKGYIRANDTIGVPAICRMILGRPEFEADAMLIAAAPRMLADLKQLQVNLQSKPNCEWELRIIKAAIAKAEGNSK